MDTVTEFTEVKGARKYRRRTVDEKRQIVEETLSSGRSRRGTGAPSNLKCNTLLV
jgi:transposase